MLFFRKNKGIFSTLSEKVEAWQVSQEVRIGFLFPATILLAAAFWFFQDNLFTILNVSLWLAGMIFFILAVWEKPQAAHKRKIKATPFLVLIILVALLSIFFRVYELQVVPSEMFSDHAEKLLDVADVLDGKTSIFFTRNTGREPLQFYLTAAIIKIFNTGISFLSLKIGTVLAGLLTLPFIYLIGKELGGKWVGLAALFFAGVGYWPNVISRVALRYAFYPLFTSATLYFLIKGLRTRNRNDFLLAGLLLPDDRLTLPRILGLLIGFAGVVVLVSDQISGGVSQLWGVAAMLAAVFLYAVSAITARKSGAHMHPGVQAFGQSLFAFLIMLPTAAVVEAPLTLPRLPLTWVAVVWLGVLGSFIASMLYLTLIQDVGPTRAMLTTYLFPLIGAALGAIFLHEQQGWQLWVGAVLILSGIGLVNQVRRHPPAMEAI